MQNLVGSIIIGCQFFYKYKLPKVVIAVFNHALNIPLVRAVFFIHKIIVEHVFGKLGYQRCEFLGIVEKGF